MATNSTNFNPLNISKRAPLTKNANESSLESMARTTHKMLNNNVRGYLNKCGINGESIDRFMLGTIDFEGCQRLTIPVFNKDGAIAYMKMLSIFNDMVAKKIGQRGQILRDGIYPVSAEPVLVGEEQLVKSTSSSVLICENELDRIAAIQEEVKMPVVTSGSGIQGFKEEWITKLKNMRNIYVCVNKTETNKNDIEEFCQRLSKCVSAASVYIVSLPTNNNTNGSIATYFAEKLGTAEELLSKYAEFYCGAEPINVAQFKELTVEDIASVLDLTIKHDFVSKVITFLVMLLAYTESDQQNVMFNADSSTGKTYICQEVSKYFPPQDVKIYGSTTPTAFYYSQNLQEKDKKTGEVYINFERRILIFTEQPDTQLQEKIRSLLSHDNKRIPFAITNKGKGGKNVAMEGYILGFPSAFFCSANMRIDEQEQTRCLILSPENSPEKIMAGIDASIAKNSNKAAYKAQIENNSSRRQLMERVLYIKDLHIDTIDIDDSEYLKSRFMENRDTLSPKAQREITHFMSLVKAMALVNAPFRMKDSRITAINKDVDEAMKLWTPLNESMSYGVSPQVLNFYKKFILPAYYTKSTEDAAMPKGVTYDEIRAEYHKQTGRQPNMENVRKQYIPALRAAALISYDKDESDKRQKLITPKVFFDDIDN